MDEGLTPGMDRSDSGASITVPDPPKSIRCPSSWKSHEAEFLQDMCPKIFSNSTNTEKWEEQSLFKADHLAKHLGAKYPRSFLDVREEDSPMTLGGRVGSFPRDWSGWPPLEMAQTGIYFENNRVKCHVCGVSFRKMTSRSVHYLQRHRDVAPLCAALRRAGCHGVRSKPDGRRRRHNSDSAIDDMDVEDDLEGGQSQE